MTEFKQEAATFGESAALAGILMCQKSLHELGGAKVAALIVGAGMLHRVGPNRLHVRLARSLASLGIPSLRFDFSGVGDSAATPQSGPDSFAQECRVALDYLSGKTGAQRFIAIGLCSGASVARELLRCESRVKWAVMFNLGSFDIDGQVRSELETQAAAFGYISKLASRRAWGRLLRGQSLLLRGGLVKGLLHGGAAKRLARAFPAMLQAKVQTGAPIWREFAQLDHLSGESLLVYSDHSLAWHRVGMTEATLQRQLGGLANVTGELLTNCDHLFTPLAAQQILIQRVQEWLTARLNGVRNVADQASCAEL